MDLLDIKKAYDTVCLNGFLYELISLHLPNYSLLFLKSCLKGLTFTVHMNDTKSSPKPTPPAFLRVPYHRHYSPRTFPTCPALRTHTTPYADDTAILCQSWRPDTISRRLSQYISTKLKPNYLTKAAPPPSPPRLTDSLQIHDNFVPCASSVSY